MNRPGYHNKWVFCHDGFCGVHVVHLYPYIFLWLADFSLHIYVFDCRTNASTAGADSYSSKIYIR